MICEKCDKEITGKAAGAHKRWCKGKESSTYSYYDKIEKIKQCIRCSHDFTILGYAKMNNYRRKRERDFCSGKCQVAHTMTDEVKAKISKSRKEYLQKNPDKHPWKRSDKFISVPCEVLKQKLRDEQIEFVEELSPLKTNAYSIDIAFPEIKLAIEVNGEQHYNRDGSLKPYYEKRNKAFEQAGWKCIQLHYTKCYSDSIVEELKTYICTHGEMDITKHF